MTDWVTVLGFIGPGLAEGLAAIGTTIGITEATASGIPAVGEDPGQRGRVFILAFLPMTQTLVYGFVYMFLMYYMILPSILSKHGGALTPEIAGVVLGVSLFVGFAEMVSAWMQGRVCGQAGAQLIKTKGGIFGTGIILAAYEELIGILGMVFGLVIAFIIVGW
ncbi:ATPase [Thermogladius sp. KZ2Tp1]|uniref:ATPase n=1 Tax=Thermogladius sp. KZ2Tp1 TaxID=3136289 RepID=UPI003DAA161C